MNTLSYSIPGVRRTRLSQIYNSAENLIEIANYTDISSSWFISWDYHDDKSLSLWPPTISHTSCKKESPWYIILSPTWPPICWDEPQLAWPFEPVRTPACSSSSLSSPSLTQLQTVPVYDCLSLSGPKFTLVQDCSPRRFDPQPFDHPVRTQPIPTESVQT